MPPLRSRPLRARRLADNVIELSSGESDNEAVSASSSEYGTAYETTNYDGSDEEDLVRRMFQTLTVETSANVYEVAKDGPSPASPSPSADTPPPSTSVVTHAPSPSTVSLSTTPRQPTKATAKEKKALTPVLHQQTSPLSSSPLPLPSQKLGTDHLNTAGKIYAIHTNEGTRIVEHWAEAGALTQGIPDTSVQSIPVRRPPKPGKNKYKAYSAIKAWRPGVYSSWRDLKAATFGASGMVYKAHMTLIDAHIHYANALNKGLVKRVDYDGNKPLPVPLPTPSGLPPPPESSTTTYVVTQGRRVGLFSDWAEAAAQVLFIKAPNVTSYPTREAAQAAFDLACQQGHVHVKTS